MPHTYLLEKGNWNVRGQYIDANKAKSDVAGTTKIDHLPGQWTSDADLIIKNAVVSSLLSHYQFSPMPDGVDNTTWMAQDPIEGTIRGTLCVVDDCLISTFRADATDYHGVDVMRKTKENAYQSRGFVMKNGARLSSWRLDLSRSAWKLEAGTKKKTKSPNRSASR